MCNNAAHHGTVGFCPISNLTKLAFIHTTVERRAVLNTQMEHKVLTKTPGDRGPCPDLLRMFSQPLMQTNGAIVLSILVPCEI